MTPTSTHTLISIHLVISIELAHVNFIINVKHLPYVCVYFIALLESSVHFASSSTSSTTIEIYGLTPYFIGRIPIAIHSSMLCVLSSTANSIATLSLGLSLVAHISHLASRRWKRKCGQIACELKLCASIGKFCAPIPSPNLRIQERELPVPEFHKKRRIQATRRRRPTPTTKESKANGIQGDILDKFGGLLYLAASPTLALFLFIWGESAKFTSRS